MRVDFHVHSTASDGTCSPTELAAEGETFAALALTDHDNVDGIGEFLSAAGGRRIAGIELSIEPGAGFDRFHLLGLGIDPENDALKLFLKRVLEGRNARNRRIVANFARLGIEMPDIDAYAHGDVLARPHFARWLTDHGHVKTIAEAFAVYLQADAPAATRCYEKRWRPTQEEAFAVVHGAGGLCIMAHPRYWRNDWQTVGCDYPAAERELAALKERGLDGIEALYQANTNEENVAFVRMADRLGYLKSAGSDFHGAHKPSIRLGMDVSESYVKPLLERLK